MKKKLKLIIPCLIIFILMGCNLNNTPTSKVEERLSQYQMMDKSIDTEDRLELFTNSDELTENQKKEYEKIIKKQYQSLSYDVKEEMIDGDTATVTVSIKVIDYKKLDEELNRETDGANITVEQYHTSRIDKFKEAKDKVNYTIDFLLTKDSNGTWNLNDLDSTIEEKLLGIY